MKKYIIITAMFFLAGIAGCKKDYLSQENNPNSPSAVTPPLLLSGSLVNTAGIIALDYTEYGVWAGYWTTSGNYVPNQAINEYQLTTTSFEGEGSGAFVDLYSNAANYNTLINLSSDPANANFLAIGLIMKSYDFEQLVDNYNDVPYFQAFQPGKFLFPAYDKAMDIYHDLGKQLDNAIAAINKNPNATTPGSSDVVFGGDMTGWKKFANSLKLRLAIHVSTKFPSDPLVTDLASTASSGYLDGSTEAIVNPGYKKQLASSGNSQQNPFWNSYGLDVNNNPPFFDVYWRGNDFSVKLLNKFNDPRVSQLYAPITGIPATATIRGNVFGDTSPNNLADPGTSAIGPGLLQSPSQGQPIFSGAESLFLQAEALQNGFNIAGGPNTPATAQAAYEAGITSSFVDLQAGGTYVSAPGAGTPQTPGFTYTPPTPGASAALAVTYYSQNINDVGWAASANKEEAIVTQKWIALNGYFNLEGYTEYRRTGIPALPSSIDPAAINPALPTRILYPINELSSNGVNLAKEGTISPFTSKIFFAK